MAIRSFRAHPGSAMTLEGLAKAIESMRWADLEAVSGWLADATEERQGEDMPLVDGQLLLDWAESYLEAHREDSDE